MSRSMHRKSLSMRWLCTYMAIIVIVSFAGVGYASPGRSTSTVQPSAENTESTPPSGGDVIEPEVPAADPVEAPADDGGEAAAPEEEPAVEEPPAEEPEVKTEPAEEPAATPAVVVPSITLPSTQQGIVPVWVNPWTAHQCDYFEFKIEAADWGNGTYQTDSEGSTLPGGASITISNSSLYQFDFAASGVLIHHVVVKAGTGAFVYDYDPNGVSADSWLYSVIKEVETACDYREISHVTFCYSQTPSTGHIIVRKYNDSNGDDDRDGGEDWLAGFTFRLEKGDGEDGPWTLVGEQTTEGMNGQADFDNQIAGWYRITELLTAEQIAAGWQPTAENPRVFYHTGEVNGSSADEETKWFGNRIVKHDKTFKLTYEGQVPANTTFHAVFTVDGVPYDEALTGSNPYFSQTLSLNDGADIGDVSWYATWTPSPGNSVEILLGTTTGEELLRDRVNSFTFGSQLQGHKYEDLDADGVKDAGEPGLSGWTIVLERQVGAEWVPYGTRVTDGSGYYKFYSVLPGHYRVSEDIASMTDFDWVQSKPATTYYEFDIAALMTATPEASVSCVGTNLTKDFMNWAPASLFASKFNDLNADGERDEGEPGLPDWIIYVDYNNNGSRDTGTALGDEPYGVTDANGECVIEGVHPGTFPVREQMVAGWTQSLGGSYVVTFESRGVYGIECPFEFGNWTTASKAGMKFHDLNANGVRDDGEPGLSGWTIYVDYNGNGIHDTNEPSAVTDVNGYYIIWNISPGTYKVREVLTGDWVQSYPRGGYYEVEFTSGLEDTGNDFGNWHPGAVEGYKFNDLDLDGTYDEGEPRMPGWTVYVDIDGDGVLDPNEPSTVTDSNGYYHIGGLTPGEYWIREVLQSDWNQSRGDFFVTVTSGETAGCEGECDFGNWTTTGLDGYKFEDKDADGEWDFGEPTKAGVTINLTGTDFLGNPVVLQTVTDVNGYYEFTNLVPGDYVVSEVVPEGWTQSYPAADIWEVTLYSGTAPEGSFDFGNWTFADPHGYKINDLDADGQIDDGEPGLEGWTINLDGTTGWGEVIHMDTLTDSEGRWEFTQVPPGTYTISETQQVGWTQSFPGDAGTYTMTLESGEMPEASFDFANWTTAAKFGMKFFDADGDGLPREEGEIGLAGWTIYVDYDGDGIHDPGEPSGVTDSNGAYIIDGIVPGTWFVREVSSDPDWMNTYPAAGYYYETFESDGVYEGNDFGNTTWVDKTFELTFRTDVPSDTTFTVTFTTEFTKSSPPPVFEQPVEPQAIAIFIEDHEVELVEDEPGVYSAVLPVWPQTYVKNVEWWAGWNGERVKLGDGAESELIDAPITNEFEYGAEIFGNKWNDTDFEAGLPGDGIWDADEAGMSGWQIELYRLNAADEWVLYDTMLTLAGGSYSFADVLPGTYYLGEVIPIDPVTLLPTWTQSAGPMGEGDEQFVVSDESAVGPVDFGNYEAALPFTLDMGLTKDVDQSTADPGDTLTYTITYMMVEGGIPEGEPFTITDDYDEEHLTVVDASGGTVADGKITWNLTGPLYTGDSGTITYKLKVDDPMPAGVTNVDNTAVITVDGDGDPSNNSDSERVKVTVAEGEPFLPFTGSEALLLLAVMAMVLSAGFGLRYYSKKEAA